MSNEQKTLTKVIIDREEKQSLLEFATVLETIASRIRKDQSFIFTEGDKQTVITPTDPLKVEYKYEIKGDKHSFEIEFDWYEGQSKNESFSIH
ncbi:amphi-Trp domain-containing protein [Vagococcus silagei]|uniref:Amphi-Trp domain-containing protein n=1 Tax=Vagococcus silagei TaxID=2508885 RepID=A0A4S3B9I4_9ENTE|nr:amphi-Trp domain-containing protein [Vagococcus silagei]THB61745.1 amphi-Trp domain-containing protein [Vagococcus silagei]